jgi:hypothetical protein
MSNMPQGTYRVRNWREYNQSLVQRGSITLWISEEVFKQWQTSSPTGKRGRPKEYADEIIQCMLCLKAVYNLPFRAVEGFVKSLFLLQRITLKVPDYSLLCKRQKHLTITLPKSRRSGEGLHLVIDSTGLKVFGEGEWKTRQHGVTKKRLWRKLHLAINSKTQMIEAVELTELGVQDCEGFVRLLDYIEDPIDTAIGDGAYDRFSCYEAIEKRGGKGIFPPQHNAVTSKERAANRKKASAQAVAKRDETVEAVRSLGSKRWKEQTGYHRRSLAETGMFRVKTILGRQLSSRHLENQIIEAQIFCSIINAMTLNGMPKTVTL